MGSPGNGGGWDEARLRFLSLPGLKGGGDGRGSGDMITGNK